MLIRACANMPSVAVLERAPPTLGALGPHMGKSTRRTTLLRGNMRPDAASGVAPEKRKGPQPEAFAG